MLQDQSASAIFARYTLGRAYDEMFAAPGSRRPHYAGIHERLCGLPMQLWRERQRARSRLPWVRAKERHIGAVNAFKAANGERIVGIRVAIPE